MTSYILNTPVLTSYGHWKYEQLSISDAKMLLENGYISAIGHQSTADFLSTILDKKIEMNRIQISMQPGDRAMVLNLKVRLPENQVLTDRTELEKLPFELALLQRIR